MWSTILLQKWTCGILYGSRDRDTDVWVLYSSRNGHAVHCMGLGTGTHVGTILILEQTCGILYGSKYRDIDV
jgi:hypothetical protein